MTTFLRLLAEKAKDQSIDTVCAAYRSGVNEPRVFDVSPDAFRIVPGAPFCYWVSESIRGAFRFFPVFESGGRTAKVGLATADDFRFLRTWWEPSSCTPDRYPCFAKGGGFSQYYADIALVLNWARSGAELKESVIAQHGNAGKRVYNEEYYFKPAITWPLRARRFSPQALPADSIFSVRGYTAHVNYGDELASLAILNSIAFDYLFKTALGRFGYPEFIVGTLQIMPWPHIPEEKLGPLSSYARCMWSKKRELDTIEETSHAFLLPAVLRTRQGCYDPAIVEAELALIQAKIDNISFELYGFSDADRAAALSGAGADEPSDVDEDDEEEAVDDAPSSDALLSWTIGVAFGRFDWRLATGERSSSPAPEPFDPLPAKSPGMLPEGATSFHQHTGILVDDPGHPHDLSRLVEQVLETVDASVSEDVRRWLQKDFFSFHLKRYSKSRRKAPIYWPLSTASGSYALWLYYPSLSNQTLFSAVNDFVDPKLENVRKELQTLRDKGAGRSKQDEKSLEALVSLEHELADLRDSLLEIAPNYRPYQDDGVQISAAPLWKLFRHKPWQKLLKDTWVKLEKGDYDWAHLAMNYWPDRVRDKCVTDKSLAIAHGLEHLYVVPEAVEKKRRGRKKAGSTE